MRRAITAAADIYSLGKVMYEASMGRDRQQYPELPTSLADRTDSAALIRLNSIILKACEEIVGKRYQSASELRAGLKEYGNCSRIVSTEADFEENDRTAIRVERIH